MTAVWPLRFRDTTGGILFTAEAGGWFVADPPFLERYATDRLTEVDLTFLKRKGFAFEREGDLAHSSYLRRWAGRHASRSNSIGYVILVPTLRCNLSCGYCQVSRAAENARGYDWNEETLAHVLAFLDGLTTDSPKIEFQGGEPLLRIDLLERVRTFCRQRFAKPSFVVCTNMQAMTDAAWAF
ncbi:MAG TPA: radical SAM protein, partial [Devosia sp.]|nr:radical SAM protein [Devosia sp.]